MDKKTPTKRKSIANAATPKPNKIQKTVATPVSQKKNNKSPKSANKNKKTPQAKQLNGKQNTPKGKKAPKQPKPEPVEDEEVEDESEENETDSSIEQENGENAVVEADSDEVDDNEDATEKKKPAKSEEDRKFSVYVGGLNGTITANHLRGFFKECTISSVFMLKSGPQNKHLSAFVNFEDEASRDKALTNSGTELKGCTIKVGLPKSKPKLPPAEYKKKNLLLMQLREEVKKLEQELGKRPSFSKFQKPTNFKQGMKGKFAGKNKANKKPIKK